MIKEYIVIVQATIRSDLTEKQLREDLIIALWNEYQWVRLDTSWSQLDGTLNELEVIDYIKQNYDVLSIAIIEYLNSIHIDYQDLIGQGLAVEVNEKQGE